MNEDQEPDASSSLLRHRRAGVRPGARLCVQNPRAGFALGPILYLLGLIGIGAGILFSGYSQILRSNIQITEDMETKNDINGDATTLSATSMLGSANNTILCPPQGGNATANCAAAPLKMESFATVAASPDVSKLPVNYANAGTTNPATGFETGVFAPGAGVKQLDPYGHFYIYCRWEQAVSDGTDNAIMIISAGPDGVLNTTCNDTAAKNDDAVVGWPATTAVNRSAIWQMTTGSNGTQAQFGEVGHQLNVDALGNLSVPGALNVAGNAAFGSTANFSGQVTAPVFYGNVAGGTIAGSTGAFSSDVTVGGVLGVTGATTLNSTLDTKSDATLEGALGVTGATTLNGTLDTKGDTTLEGVLGVTGATTLNSTLNTKGNTTLEGALNVTSTAIFGTTTGQQAIVTPTGFITANSGFAGNLSGNVTGNVAGNIAGSTGAFSSSLSVGGTSSVLITADGNGIFAGTIQAANFSGAVTGSLDLANGGSITGMVPVTNGGTGASTAVGALANLGVTSGGVLNVAGLLTAGLIPGDDIATGSVPDAALVASGVTAGTYNSVTVNAQGLVTSASIASMNTNNIADGNGDSVIANGGAIAITTSGVEQDIFDANGNLGLGTLTPQTKLDVDGNVRIDGANATSRELQFTTSNSERWIVSTTNTSESGTANGSNFEIAGYDNNGNLIGPALVITRSSLAATFTGSVTTPTLIATTVDAGSESLTGTLTGAAAVFSGTVTASNFSGSTGYFTGTVTASSFSGTISGTLSLPDGAALTPSLYFTNENTTGVFRAGTDRFGFAVGGVESLELESAANATDYVTITPAASGAAPVIGVAGSTNEGLILGSAGSGNLTLTPGTSGAVNVSAGNLDIAAGALQLSTTTILAFPHANADISGLALGPGALASQTAATGANTALGAQALQADTAGSANTAVGYTTLLANTSGNGNVAVGNQALLRNTTGNNNTALGAAGMFANITGSGNIAVGSGALTTDTTGDSNSAIGYQALEFGVGAGNTAFGSRAGASITTGTNNVVIGPAVASNALTVGSNDILIGTTSAVDATTSSQSNWLNIGNTIYADMLGQHVSIGSSTVSNYAVLDLSSAATSLVLPGNSTGTTGRAAITGSNAIDGMIRYNSDTPGVEAYINGEWTTLLSDTSSGVSSSLFLGSATTANPAIAGDLVSGFYTPGAQTVAVEAGGIEVQQWNTLTGGTDYLSIIPGKSGTPIALTATGSANAALTLSSTGSGNITLTPGATGNAVVTAGNLNVAAGAYQQLGNTILTDIIDGAGNPNLAVGIGALSNQSTGASNSSNTGIGYASLLTNTTGYQNTAVGYSALYYNQGGFNNTAQGYEALYYSKGANNTGFGAAALAGSGFVADTGNGNTALGAQALKNIGSGGNNTAVGQGAMQSKADTTSLAGNDNTALGYQAMLVIRSAAAQNTAIGDSSLVALTTGVADVVLGYNAGSKITVGTSNVIMGSAVASNTLTTGSNNILIGTTSGVDTPGSGTNNWLNIGNTVYGDMLGQHVGIGTATPSSYAVLDLSGAATTLVLPGNSTGTAGRTGITGSNAIDGMVRYNSDTPGVEAYVNGAWETLLSDTSSGVSSSLFLGSATTANPAIAGDLVSGFYTPGAQTVAVEAGGIEVQQWNTLTGGTDYLSIIPGKSGTPIALTATGSANAALTLSSTGSGNITLTPGATGNLAAGYNVSASGGGAVALGTSTTASGQNSIVMGVNSISSGSGSVAIGGGAQATANSSTAIGSSTQASGAGSTALGYLSKASGAESVALGDSTTAAGDFSTAMGFGTIASGTGSTAMGRTSVAAGDYSTAIGYITTAASYNEAAMGRYNVGGGTGNSWVATDPLFEIGNGASAGALADAMIVYKNGTVALGSTTSVAGYELTSNGGVYGSQSSGSFAGVAGIDNTTTGATGSGAGAGIYAAATGSSNTADAVYALNSSTSGYAIYANGAVNITGNLNVSGTCTGCVGTGSVTIGSATTAAPFISGEPASGFYTTGANVAAVEMNGVPVEQWNTLSSGTDYLNVTPGNSSNAITLAATSTGSNANPALTLSTAGAGNITLTPGSSGYVTASSANASYGVSSTNNNTGSPAALYGAATGAANTGYGVYGINTATSGANYGGYFTDASSSGYGVYGISTDTGGLDFTYGVYGSSASGNGAGVYGTSSSATGAGVYGAGTGSVGTGVYGIANVTNGTGVFGTTNGTSGMAVAGLSSATTGFNVGVKGSDSSPGGIGVFGTNSSTGAGTGIYGNETGTANTGFAGYFTNSSGGGYGIYTMQTTTTGATTTGAGAALFASATGAGNTDDAIYALNNSTSGYAIYANGAVNITGNLTLSGTCTGCVAGSSSINLGSATTANPAISGELTSGFYTAGANLIDVEADGTQIAEWSSSGETIAYGNLNIAAGALQLGAITVLAFPDSNADSTSLAVGSGVLASQTTINLANTGIGFDALRYNSIGNSNTAVGYMASEGISSHPLTGASNTAVGAGALKDIESFSTFTPSGNTAVGANALDGGPFLGSDNTALGAGTGTQLFGGGGDNNVLVGYSVASTKLATGAGNILIGTDATTDTALAGTSSAVGIGTGVIVGAGDTAVGYQALHSTTTDNNENVAFGYQAGDKITIGSSNVLIGPAVASNTLTTGSNNILIGTTSGVDTPGSGTNNWLNIGNTVYGDMLGQHVGIGTATPSSYAVLDLSGAATTLVLPGNSTGTAGRTGITGSNAIDGMVRYNSDTPAVEAYIGGAWTSLLSDTSTGVSSSLYLGSSTTANPGIFNEPASGFYTTGANVAAVEMNGIPVEQWNTLSSGTDYLNITPGKSGTAITLAATSTGGANANPAITLTTTGSGNISLQLGASGNFAAGYKTSSSGGNSTALGYQTTASGSVSTAMGAGTVASGGTSVAMGSGTVASNNYSTAMGFQTVASGPSSTAMGVLTVASGQSSTALGFATTAASYDEVAMGRFNSGLSITSSSTGWLSTDPLFEIGNGASAGALADAMIVYKDGTVALGSTTSVAGYELTSNGGVYGSQTSSSYAGIYGINSGTGAGTGVYGNETGTANTGYGGYFTNASGSGYGIYALEATTTGATTTGAGAALFASATGAGNTDDAIYALNSSTSGYAIYANGAVNITGNLNVTGTCTGCVGTGSVTIGSATTAAPFISGEATSGFYTTGANVIAIEENAVPVEQWNTLSSGTDYLNITPGKSGTAITLAATSTGGSNANPAITIATTGSGNITLTPGTSGEVNVSAGNLNVATGTYQLSGITVLKVIEDQSSIYNLGVGVGALASQTSSAFISYNTAVGTSALAHNTTGAQNTAIGYLALYNAAVGVNNTAQGYKAAAYWIGNDNTAVGGSSLSNTAAAGGNGNTVIGDVAMANIFNGSYNTVVGVAAMQGSSSSLTAGGSDNTALGYQALRNINDAGTNQNTAIGDSSLSNLTTGSNNVALGYNTGASVTTDSGDILIGSGIDTPSVGTSDLINIGNTIYGNTANGFVSIGTTSLQSGYDLTVNGGVYSTQASGANAAVYGLNTTTTGAVATGAGAALYASATGASNTADALYATNSSSSGYAIYANGNSYLNGTTTISGNLNVTGTCTGCAAAPTIGSVTTASPYITGEATSGFYTTGANVIAVEENAVPVEQWNTLSSGTDYLNVTPGKSGTAITLAATSTGGSNANPALTISTTGSGAIALMPGGTGAVGIGTASPAGLLTVQHSSYVSDEVLLQDGTTTAPPAFPNSYLPTLTVETAEVSASRPLWFGYQNGSSWDAFLTSGACGSFSQMCVDLGSGGTVQTALENKGSALYLGGGDDGNFIDVVIPVGLYVNSTTPQAGYEAVIDGGLYSAAGSSNAGIYGTSGSTGAGYGIYGSMTGANNTGYAGYFTNTATTANYGVYSTIASVTTGAAVAGIITGVGNTGYAGYFANTATTSINYGLYASTSSSTGYAGYFQGQVNITGNLNVTGTCTGCVGTGSVTIGSATTAAPFISGEATSGFYTTGANVIAIEENAVPVEQWNTLSSGTDYLNVTPGKSGTAITLAATSTGGSNANPALTLSTTGSGNITLTPGTSGSVNVSSGNLTVSSGTATASSFTPTSSTVPANGMYYQSANALGFSTSGSNALTITATGSVGIGTTSPSALFNVVYSDNNFNGGIVLNNTNTGSHADASIAIYNSDGNEGSLAYPNSSWAYGFAGTLIFASNTGEAFWADTTTGGSHNIDFSIGNAAPILMRITPSAGVGIGTTSLQSGYDLTVNGGVYSAQASGANAAVYGLNTTTTGAVATGAGAALYASATGASNTADALYATNSSSSGYAIYANGNSYLNGTTTISGNLNVTGTCTGCAAAPTIGSVTTASPYITGEATSGFYTTGANVIAVEENAIPVEQWNTLSSGTDYLNVTPGKSGTAITLAATSTGGSNANPALTISTTGSGAIALMPGKAGAVGIGTTTPSGTLDIEGGLAAGGTGANTTIVAQTGNGTYGGNIILTSGGDNAGDYGSTLELYGAGVNNGWGGGDITLTAGTGNNNASPGRVFITGGVTQNNGGGSINISGGPGANSTGGSVYIASGTAGTTGTGSVYLGITSGGSVLGNIGIRTATLQSNYAVTSNGGLYATSTAAAAAVYGSNSNTGAGYGIYGSETGTANTGYAGYFTNSSGSGYGVYVMQTTTTGAVATGAGAALYASATGASNTADALYATNSSGSGYAGYFNGAVNVTGNLTVTSCTGCAAAPTIGSVTTASPYITGEATSGFYTTGANVIAIEENAIPVEQWNTLSSGTDYINITPGKSGTAITLAATSTGGSNANPALTLSTTGSGNITLTPGTTGSVNVSSGNLTVSSGTATASSFTPTSSTVPANGMYYPSTNALGFSTSGSNALTITATGSVGIGTASPSALLTIQGKSNGDGILINSTSSNSSGASDNVGLTIANTGPSGLTWGIDSTGNTSGFGPSSLVFVEGGLFGTARMTIKTGGAVGIGTTSLQSGYDLTVNGGVYSTQASGANAAVYGLNTTTTGAVATGAGAALYASATGASNTADALYATNSSSSGYAIYANGNSYLNGTTTISGNLNVTGTCTGCAAAPTLGSLTTESPYISGDATSGFYTAGAHLVDVGISGVKVAEWASTGQTVSGTVTANSFIPTSSTAPANGMYLPAANSLGFSTSGSNALTITSTGSVGIGTTTPSYPLHIVATTNQTVEIDSTNTVGSSFALNSVPGGGHNFQFFSTGSGNSGGPGSFGVYDLTSSKTLLWINGTSGNAAVIQGAVYGWSPSTSFATNTLDAGFSRLASAKIAVGNGTSGDYSGTLIAGSAGIGTTSLQSGYDLTVNGGAYSTQASGANAAVYGLNTTTTGAVATGAGAALYASATGASNTADALYATNSSGTGYAGYFNGAVNVTGALTVASCTGCSSGASLSALTGSTTANTIDNVAYAQSWSWNTLSTGTAFSLSSSSMTTGAILSVSNTATASNAGTALNVNNSEAGGSYGIKATNAGAANTGYAGYFANTATTGANYGLYASNASTSGYGVYATNSNSSGTAFYCSSSNATGCGGNENWYNSSDRRLKDRIENLPDDRGLAAVLKLRPVTYHWKDRSMDQRKLVGFIAQEVEPLYPEMVGTNADGMKTLAYSELVVPLVKAVQEQQVEIEQIKTGSSKTGKTSALSSPGADSSQAFLFAAGGFAFLMLAGMGGMGLVLVRTRRELQELRKPSKKRKKKKSMRR